MAEPIARADQTATPHTAFNTVALAKRNRSQSMLSGSVIEQTTQAVSQILQGNSALKFPNGLFGNPPTLARFTLSLSHPGRHRRRPHRRHACTAPFHLLCLRHAFGTRSPAPKTATCPPFPPTSPRAFQSVRRMAPQVPLFWSATGSVSYKRRLSKMPFCINFAYSCETLGASSSYPRGVLPC